MALTLDVQVDGGGAPALRVGCVADERALVGASDDGQVEDGAVVGDALADLGGGGGRDRLAVARPHVRDGVGIGRRRQVDGRRFALHHVDH